MTSIDRGRASVAGRLLLLALLPLAAAACGSDARAGAEAGNDLYERVINVEVMPLDATHFTETIRLTGNIQAYQDVVVSAEESGVIRQLLVERGSTVRAGQPIMRVDDRILRAQVEEARARAALATETWERRRRLFEDDGVGSELAYLEARYNAEQARAHLQTLEERLGRTVVRAPISGILDTREVEVGTMVAAGTPVARIVRIDPVKIQGGVPERYAGDVVPGSAARVTFDAMPGRAFDAEVRYVGATVNPRNRTFEVELVIPNPGRVIKPEMVANIRIVRRGLEDAVVIPQDALVRVEDGFVAFVLAERQGREVAEVRSLRLGPAQRNLVVIEQGIEPGDRLIVVGHKQVADGDLVRVVATQEPVRDRGGER